MYSKIPKKSFSKYDIKKAKSGVHESDSIRIEPIDDILKYLCLESSKTS